MQCKAPFAFSIIFSVLIFLFSSYYYIPRFPNVGGCVPLRVNSVASRFLSSTVQSYMHWKLLLLTIAVFMGS